MTSHNMDTIYFQIGALYDIFCGILRMPGVQNHRFVLEPMSKLISHSLQNFNIPFQCIVSVCHLCNKSFLKERDKLLITRTAVFELISALKFKTIIPDSNFLVLTNLVLQDAGGSVIEDIDGKLYLLKYHFVYSTQCARTGLNKRFLPKPMTTTG